MKSVLSAVLVAGLLAVAPQAGAAIVYTATLDGASEAPPNASPGTGSSTLVLDLVAHTMRVIFSFADLGAPSTAMHIHGPTEFPGVGTAGVMTTTPTFADSPLGVTSGSYDKILDTLAASTYNPAFLITHGGNLESAEAALAAALAEGKAYLNIHSQNFPAGEIRGFYSAVPLPAAVGPLLLGLAGLVALKRAGRRRPA